VRTVLFAAVWCVWLIVPICLFRLIRRELRVRRELEAELAMVEAMEAMAPSEREA
jgi:hypothetical protein